MDLKMETDREDEEASADANNVQDAAEKPATRHEGHATVARRTAANVLGTSILNHSCIVLIRASSVFTARTTCHQSRHCVW